MREQKPKTRLTILDYSCLGLAWTLYTVVIHSLPGMVQREPYGCN